MPFEPVGSIAAAVGVVISGAPPLVYVNDVFQLTATAVDSGGNAVSSKSIAWSSLTPASATVDADGTVTVIGAGAVTIQAVVDGITQTVTVQPAAAVATVLISGYSSALTVGGAPLQLTATLRDAGGAVLFDRVVNWTTSDPLVVQVDSGGKVFPVGLGTAVITATSEGQSDTQEIAVRGDIATLTLGAAPADGFWTLINETITLSATTALGGVLVPSAAETVITSSHPAFATGALDASGNLVVSPLADSGGQIVTITVKLRGLTAIVAAIVRLSIRSQILLNGGVEWVPGLGDRQKPRTMGPGITRLELENASASNGPVCWHDATGRPRVVGDGVRHPRKPPTIAGAFHFHNITVVGTDTTPIPGIEPNSFGRIFTITDPNRLSIHATNTGETAWKGGGMEYNFEADRNTKLGARKWLRGFIYVHAPLAADVGKEILITMTANLQVMSKIPVKLTATPTRYELKAWIEGAEIFNGTIHFVWPPTLAGPSQIAVYGPGIAPAEWDVPVDLLQGDYRWTADTVDGVATDAWAAFRAWPMGQLGLFVGDVSYNAVGASWAIHGGNWVDENGVNTLAVGTVRNPDRGFHGDAESLFVDITMPNGARRRMVDTHATPFESLNAPDSTNLKGVGMLCVAWIAAGPSGALPADGALEAYCNPSNGDGGVKVGPMKRYRRIPGTDIWEYRGLTAPYSFTHTSTLFRGGIQNASGGQLRFEIGPVIVANSAANGARDESGIWPADYWPYWYGGLTTAEAKKQHSKAQRPSIYPQSALFNRVAGVYINRFAIPYNPATDLSAAAGMQEIVKHLSDGGVTGNFGDTLNSQFRCGKPDTGQVPEFHMGLEAYPGSGFASASAGTSLTGANAGLFADTFEHHDIIMRWNGKIIVDWAIDPIDVATVASGPGWRTDGITGPATGDDEFSANAWCPWDDRDFRMAIQGWGFGVLTLKGAMPSREACMALLRAWGPKQRIDFNTGLKVPA